MNLLRVAIANRDCSLVGVAEKNREMHAQIRQEIGNGVPLCNDHKELDRRLQGNYDAVLVATEVSQHYPVVDYFLNRAKHVFCEKPLSDSVMEAAYLETLANEKDRVLMTGHVYLFNDCVRYIKARISEGTVGKLIGIDAKRTGYGPFRDDVGVIFDLASHDVAMAIYLTGKLPETVLAVGSRTWKRAYFDQCTILLEFEDGLCATLRVSIVNYAKERLYCIQGTEEMIVFDDMAPHDRIRIYRNPESDRPHSESPVRIDPNEPFSVDIIEKEPLANEIAAFIQAVNAEKDPLSDAQFAVDVVRVLEAARTSALNNSKRVTLAFPPRSENPISE